MKYCLALFIPLLFMACDKEKTHTLYFSDTTKTALKYAENFSIEVDGAATIIKVARPFQGATSGLTYLLVPHGEDIPSHDPDTKVIRIPVSSIVCTSTTHIPFLDYLQESTKLVGFPSTDYISSEIMRARIDSGKVRDLGIDKGINLELLVSLKPDLLMGYTLSGDFGQYKKIEELGIPVIINAEYLEKHPLGRAEWIKFAGAFFQKEKQADSIFGYIEKEYLETKALVKDEAHSPTVFSGVMYGDAWFLPGGKNYAATILKDAACQYLWSEDLSSGYMELSFESVYAKAHAADLWVGVGTYASLAQLKSGDHRYAKFSAFNNKKVYNYDARKGAKGGNEFLELGYLRPDLILADLVKISHPHLLPEYQLFFHRKLE